MESPGQSAANLREQETDAPKRRRLRGKQTVGSTEANDQPAVPHDAGSDRDSNEDDEIEESKAQLPGKRFRMGRALATVFGQTKKRLRSTQWRAKEPRTGSTRGCSTTERQTKWDTIGSEKTAATAGSGVKFVVNGGK